MSIARFPGGPVSRFPATSQLERTFRCRRQVTMEARSLGSWSWADLSAVSKPAFLHKRNRDDTSLSQPTAISRCRANSRPWQSFHASSFSYDFTRTT